MTTIVLQDVDLAINFTIPINMILADLHLLRVPSMLDSLPDTALIYESIVSLVDEFHPLDGCHGEARWRHHRAF